ncbi:MAG TPA: branched-chain amino acid ABC transporter permease [Candidatus Polarisedimenticolia bacterium]|nr:branched-chain amino acid ABC transporter permease [Candidatus Polarisedimenticolia bacterium]
MQKTDGVARSTRQASFPGLQWAVVAGFVILAFGAPYFIYPVFLMKVLCFALFACAYNLLFGYTGLLGFGHAAFFGAASYVAAYTAKFWNVTPEVAIVLGTAVAGLFGLVFGWLAIRRQGLYFAMITLALAQIVYFYALQSPWTHGEDGIQSVPRGHAFGLIDVSGTISMYFFVLAVFAIGFGILYRAIHSPFGRALKAIRENEPRAVSLGYDTDRFKLLAFTLSAALSGLAGGTKAIVLQVASLADLHYGMSGDVLLMVLIGGIGTVMGPIAGAVVLVAMQEYLAPLGSWVTIIQGSVFVACVLSFRKGLVGTLGNSFARLRRHRRFSSRRPALAAQRPAGGGTDSKPGALS